MNETIYVATAADENYARGLLVMLATLLKSNKGLNKKCFSIIILDGGLSHDTKSKIELLPQKFTISNEIKFYFMVPDLSHLTHVPKLWGKSNLTLARLQIAELIPKADYVYWIDSDFIINKPLPHLDCLGEKMIAACVEPHLPTLEEDFTKLEYPFGTRKNESKPYINAGFMIINLKKWRQQKIGEKGTDAMCKYPESFKWMDQSVINFFAADNIAIINPNYNYNLHDMDSNKYLEKHWQDCNLHLTGALKPWAIDSYQTFFYFQHLVFLSFEILFFNKVNEKELAYLNDLSYTKPFKWKIKMLFSFIFNRSSHKKKKSYIEMKLNMMKYFNEINERLLSH